MNELITAKEWFSLGTRVPYDPVAKKIVRPGEATDAADAVHVFQRVVRDGGRNEEAVWTTFLPGFPDGSFGWASVDQHLSGNGMAPKLYVEFVGRGQHRRTWPVLRRRPLPPQAKVVAFHRRRRGR